MNATASTAPPPPPPRATSAPPPETPKPKGFGKLDTSKESPRVILSAVEGWGKTSIAVQPDNTAILMAEGETGYSTLLKAGRVPERDAAVSGTWTETLELLTQIEADGRYDWLVLDAFGGFERQCHQFVCDRDFKGDWGEKGFTSFHRGYDVSIAEWLKVLAQLDAIRAKHGTGIILLSHVIVKPYKNPMGPDYDRIIADVHQKTWGPTAKWADAVLFGNFHTVVDEVKPGSRTTSAKGKGIGMADRVLYTERRDAFDAKNRYGMLPEMDLGAEASDNWNIIKTAMNGGNHAA